LSRLNHHWICLMYHEVTPGPATSGAGDWFSVSGDTFSAHLDLIRDGGFAGCTVAEALSGASGTRRPVAISFDDGSAGQYGLAFPALVRRGMTATFFVTTGWVGTPGYVTWSQLREMSAAGMSIQSHTHSHPFLSELSADELEDELHRSKSELDQHLGQNTDQISLPGGNPPRRRDRGIIARTGYRVVGTSIWGRNAATALSGIPEIRRCTVRGSLDPREFTRIIAGDPWLQLTRGIRGNALNLVREALGPTRYARWRRTILNAVR
jgi:peptidoglycan/xylan/chitin deacetylase (PgdA/CDA1 family)